MNEELTKEDIDNIGKWIAAASMMIEAKLRTTWSDSELNTLQKIHEIKYGY